MQPHNTYHPADAGASHTTVMQIRFSSLHELLPGICQAGAAFVGGACPMGSHKLFLVLRELLGNAIEHGNANDAAQEVSLRITRLAPEAVEVAISDQGGGFESESVDLRPLAEPAACPGGGLRLVNALSDALYFENGGRRIVCRLSWDSDIGLAASQSRQSGTATQKE